MRITRHISYFTIILATVLLGLSSCRSSKNAVGTAGELSNKGRSDLFDDLLSKNLDYKTISGKVTLELKAGKNSQKVGAQVKIIKDEVIQLSIRPFLGMEVFRATITPDSVLIVDRMNKKYTAEDINKMQEKIHFNFYNLQALFTNSIFVPTQKSVSKKDLERFSVTQTKDVYMLGVVNNKTTYNFAVDASDRVVSTLIFDQNKNTIQWSYSNFVKDNDYIYPSQMLAKIEIKDRRMDIGFEFPSLDFNKNLDIDYSVSNKYQKVSLAEILKITSLIK